jgi:hypothetical protein
MSSPSIRDPKKKSNQVYMISKFNISRVEYGHLNAALERGKILD